MKILRIIDANINRTGEGLRVVEEVARFALNHGPLTGELKAMRHLLTEAVALLPRGKAGLLAARDANEDVGADSFSPGEKKRDSLKDLFLANIRRVQEGARVLEEFTKTKSENAAFKFKELRYRAYTLEKEMLFLLEGPGFPGGLYVITGSEFTKGRPLLEVVAQAIEGGAKVVQLREKETTARELLKLADKLRVMTKEAGVAFIVNDRVDLAKAAEADGVHLGQDDLPLEVARELLGRDKLIGISTHSLEQAVAAEEAGADYIGVGPVFPTATKENLDPVVGLELLTRIKEAVNIPIVAIGGINDGNAAQVVEAGADSIAVITAVMGANDVAAAAKRLQGLFTQRQSG
ncbi:MAG: thiamine phosphate synthase [Clostridia bacterium]|nr:thiamine phosphate synthase [Clostridia bacterium]